MLRLNPGFFAVAALSLVLGIGANAAIFQLLNAVRLRMLPVPHPEQLAELKIAENEHCCSGNFSDRHPNFTFPQWQQIRTNQQAFSSLFAWGDNRFNLAERGEARYAEGLWVNGDFFKTLGVPPLLGRLLADQDDQQGCGSPGVVISYPFWQRQFGGDAGALGQEFSLDGHRVAVLGVTPASFSGVEVGKNFDVAVPLCAELLISGESSHMHKRHHCWLAVIGRLKPGWSVERAAVHASTISKTVFENTVPQNYRPDGARYYAEYELTASPAASGVSNLRRAYQQPLYLLLGIAGLVLLIAYANLANLMLARASTREREIAVRLAIGAGRSRLIRQMLTESLLLAVIGAGGGVVIAQLVSRYLVSFLTKEGNPVFLELSPDWNVLGFTAGIGMLTCILFGLYPALCATRTAPVTAMKAAGRGLTSDRESFGLRRVLVVTQVALSLVLLVGALLFVRSLRNLTTLDAGFRENGLSITAVDISQSNFNAQRRAVFYRELLARVHQTPGVVAAATTTIVPVSGSGWNDLIEIVVRPPAGRMISWFSRGQPRLLQNDGYAADRGPSL